MYVFEIITRKAYQFTTDVPAGEKNLHPFERVNIHGAFPMEVKELFDNGHYSQATFEAFKFIDREIARLTGQEESGYRLMMSALNEDKPLLKLNLLGSVSEKDEQKGFKFLFAGGSVGIRNPRGHEYAIRDDPGTCIDHLSFGSMLLRKLEEAGYVITNIT